MFKDNYLNKLIGLAAELNSVDRQVLEFIYNCLLKELNNPYLTIEYLIIKSIDANLSKMAIQQGDTILNVGCGYPINEIISHSWGIAERIVGIDINDKTIQKGKEWLDDLGVTTVELYQGSALSLHFPRESFDIAVSYSAMEHVRGYKNYEKWIENMSNIVKREIVLTTSNKKNIPLFLFRKLGRIEGYEHFFTRQQIEELLYKHNLKTIYFDTNTLWYSGYVPVVRRVLYNNYQYLLMFDLLLEKLRKNILKSYGGRMGFIAKKIV